MEVGSVSGCEVNKCTVEFQLSLNRPTRPIFPVHSAARTGRPSCATLVSHRARYITIAENPRTAQRFSGPRPFRPQRSGEGLRLRGFLGGSECSTPLRPE